MSMPTRGGCLCGAVAFTVGPPYPWFAFCHCSLCRKQHGSLFGSSLGVARSALRWLQGADDIEHYRVTPAFDRPFCRHCGAALPAVSHDERYWHVPAGLLDERFDAKPRSHIFFASRSPLTELDDALPRHEAYPPGSAFPPAVAQHAHAGSALGGSCLCGTVEFAADVLPKHVVNCYCSLCRRSRGTAFSSTLLMRTAGFRFVRGEARIARWSQPAPQRYATDFCAACGSPMPSIPVGTPNVLIPAGAIDTLLPPLPAVHLHVSSKAAWYDIPGAAPQFAERPPPHRLAEFFG